MQDFGGPFLFLVKVEKVIQISYSGRRIHREPPCVTLGAGNRPGGIPPPQTSSPSLPNKNCRILGGVGSWSLGCRIPHDALGSPRSIELSCMCSRTRAPGSTAAACEAPAAHAQARPVLAPQARVPKQPNPHHLNPLIRRAGRLMPC